VNASVEIAARMGPPKLTGLRIVLARSKLRRSVGSVTHGAICIVHRLSRSSPSLVLALALSLAVTVAVTVIIAVVLVALVVIAALVALAVVAVVAVPWAFIATVAVAVVVAGAFIPTIVVGIVTPAIPAIVSVSIIVPTPASAFVAPTSTVAAPTFTVAAPTSTVAAPTFTVAALISTVVPSPAVWLKCGQLELNFEIFRRIVQPGLDALVADGGAQGHLRRRAAGIIGLNVRRLQLRPAGRIQEREDDDGARHRPAGAVQRFDDEGRYRVASRSALLVARQFSELSRLAVPRKQEVVTGTAGHQGDEGATGQVPGSESDRMEGREHTCVPSEGPVEVADRPIGPKGHRSHTLVPSAGHPADDAPGCEADDSN
jgi:hypothetical protein